MQKNSKHILYILLLACLTHSCRLYRISDDVERWLPYEPGQKIIFESNSGKIDTLFILKKEYYNNPEDHLALISPHHQNVVIDAKVPHNWTNPMGTNFKYSHQSIIDINADAENTTIDICFKPHGYYFESNDNTFKEISQTAQTMKIGAIVYTDIVVFSCTSTVFCSKEKTIQKLVWSRRSGIVQYELGQQVWNLKQTINN